MFWQGGISLGLRGERGRVTHQAMGCVALSELWLGAVGEFQGRCPWLMSCAPLGLKKAYRPMRHDPVEIYPAVYG